MRHAEVRFVTRCRGTSGGTRMQGRLQAARQARGWSQTRLIHELQRRAADARVPVMSPGSLRTAVSRWENGRVTPDAVYRKLLRETFGLSDAELGFGREPVAT